MTESALPDPFPFTAPLSVCVDVKHPQAYLALAPVRALADELGIDVDWLPFPTQPLKPPPALTSPQAPADDRGTRHRRLRAEYWRSEIARYAEAQGIVIDDPFRQGESTAASLAHLWLRSRAPEAVPGFLERMFADYWRGSLDAGDVEAVADRLVGLDGERDAFLAFARGDGAAALAELRARLVSAGVFSVPSLVVEGEVFVGRAHLPMVRWVLGGRRGAPPI